MVIKLIEKVFLSSSSNLIKTDKVISPSLSLSLSVCLSLSLFLPFSLSLKIQED